MFTISSALAGAERMNVYIAHDSQRSSGAHVPQTRESIAVEHHHTRIIGSMIKIVVIDDLPDVALRAVEDAEQERSRLVDACSAMVQLTDERSPEVIGEGETRFT
jgi:hypothetical protein